MTADNDLDRKLSEFEAALRESLESGMSGKEAWELARESAEVLYDAWKAALESKKSEEELIKPKETKND